MATSIRVVEAATWLSCRFERFEADGDEADAVLGSNVASTRVFPSVEVDEIWWKVEAIDALEVGVGTVPIVGRIVGRFDAAASVAGDEIVEDAV